MKTIYIFRNEKPFWKEITEYLKAVNARAYLPDGDFASQNISEGRPDLIVTNEGSYAKASDLFGDTPKIVITEGTAPERKPKGVHFLIWPFNRDSLLELTARLLYISGRRLFKTVISLMPKDEDKTYLGRSLNFSMSGMAFKVDKALNPGDILTASFFIPGWDERLSVDVEVMRVSVDPDDGTAYYGSRFLNLEKATSKVLEGFINKIK